MSLKETESFVRKNLHLPRFGQTASHGLFSGSDALLASVEEGYLHLFSHEKRLVAIERALLAGSPANAAIYAGGGTGLLPAALVTTTSNRSPSREDRVTDLIEAIEVQKRQIDELRILNERQSQRIQEILQQLGALVAAPVRVAAQH